MRTRGKIWYVVPLPVQVSVLARDFRIECEMVARGQSQTNLPLSSLVVFFIQQDASRDFKH